MGLLKNKEFRSQRWLDMCLHSGAVSYEYSPNYDTNKDFTKDHGTLLVEYIKQSAYMHYGLIVLDLRKLACEFAKENHVKYPIKWDKDKLSGEGWTRLFSHPPV